MGSSKKKTKQVYKPPEWVEDASKQAIGLGRQIGSQAYESYGGDRVAGLSENEQRALTLAGQSEGQWKRYLDQGEAALSRMGERFTDTDIQGYMNPYIRGALEPAAREVRESGARRLADLRATRAQRDAFGGSRGALLESEAQRGTEQTLSDLYARGYGQAFESAADRWERDRAVGMQEAQGYNVLAQLYQDATQADINALMTTGATDRTIRQSLADFDYQQFREGRDWDVRNLAGLLSAIQGTQGSYSTTTTTTEKQSGGAASQLLGLAATIGGAVMTGGASLATLGGALSTAGQSVLGGKQT